MRRRDDRNIRVEVSPDRIRIGVDVNQRLRCRRLPRKPESQSEQQKKGFQSDLEELQKASDGHAQDIVLSSRMDAVIRYVAAASNAGLGLCSRAPVNDEHIHWSRRALR
jgi:hypothetical protein